MSIQKLSAVFNRQEAPPLDFVPGLNIIKVRSRESASAWTALIHDMLYGPDPGSLPRSSASQGRLEATTPWGAVMVMRWTAAEDAPLSAFSAAYANGSQPAAYLTPANSGEILTGISQERFDRHAVIRTPISGDGQSALAELRSLSGVLEDDQTEHSQLQARADQLKDQLDRHDAADRREAALAAESAHLDYSSLRDKVKTLEASKRGLPTRAELTSLLSSLKSLDAQGDLLRLADLRVDQAERSLRSAEAALTVPPQEEPPYEDLSLRLRPSAVIPCGALLAGLAEGAAVFYATQNLLVAIGGGLGLFGLIMLIPTLLLLRRQRRHRKEVEERRSQAASAHALLSENVEKAQALYQEEQSSRDALSDAYQAELSKVLTGIHSFRPFVKDLDAARQAIADAFLVRRELDQVLQEAEDARRRWDAVKAGAVYPLPPPVRRPASDRESLRRELAEVQARLDAIQAQFLAVMEEHTEIIFTKLTQTRYNDETRSEYDVQLCLAVRLAICGMTLPASCPLVLEVALDHLDGDSLTAALDLLVELSQSRQILLLTSLDREVSCLRRTHPDRFHLIKL